MITLYGGPTPNARKIGIALHEMALDWQLEPIDILAGDQLTPAFLALNPNNKTPVIVDDDGPDGDLILWETGAILLYLAEKTRSFVPADPVARARCWQWLMFQVSGVGPMFGQEAHFVHYAAERLPYPITRYTRETDRLMRVLDGHCAVNEWLAGEEYSIADMAMLPYLRRRLTEQASGYPHVARWGAAMMERPAVQFGMAVGIARAETIEGGLDGFSDEHRSILWGDRQHAPR